MKVKYNKSCFNELISISEHDKEFVFSTKIDNVKEQDLVLFKQLGINLLERISQRNDLIRYFQTEISHDYANEPMLNYEELKIELYNYILNFNFYLNSISYFCFFCLIKDLIETVTLQEIGIIYNSCEQCGDDNYNIEFNLI